jgi:hypothetical protein
LSPKSKPLKLKQIAWPGNSLAVLPGLWKLTGRYRYQIFSSRMREKSSFRAERGEAKSAKHFPVESREKGLAEHLQKYPIATCKAAF